jgi:hypothetical protein
MSSTTWRLLAIILGVICYVQYRALQNVGSPVTNNTVGQPVVLLGAGQGNIDASSSDPMEAMPLIATMMP